MTTVRGYDEIPTRWAQMKAVEKACSESDVDVPVEAEKFLSANPNGVASIWEESFEDDEFSVAIVPGTVSISIRHDRDR